MILGEIRCLGNGCSSSLSLRFSEAILFYDAAIDQMLLDNDFEHLGGAGVVPDTFGVDYGYGAVLTYSQAIDFAAVDISLVRQSQFAKSFFQEFPGLQTCFLLAAFRVGLVGAQKDVTFYVRDSAFLRNRYKGFFHVKKRGKGTLCSLTEGAS